VKDDNRFERHGLDLLARLQVSYTQALLGTEMSVGTIGNDGKEEKITITVPAGTNSGERVRLDKRGVPSLRGGGRGSLFFEVEVVVPKKLGKDEEKLLRDLAKARGEEVLPPKKGLFR
jgi:molecular chaperone DnaJ